MATDTWFPAVGTRVRCVDTGYTTCPERPYIGQIGTVCSIFKDMEWSGHDVLVIEFTVNERNAKHMKNKADKTTFKEYLDFTRNVSLYYEPVL